LIIENFIESFSELRSASLNYEFKNEVNHTDGVSYPLICRDIPPRVYEQVMQNLHDLFGRPPKDPVIFMRRSPKGIVVPHIVHSDKSMGDYSLMLYINEESPTGSGTSFVNHVESGVAYSGTSPAFNNIIVADQNKIEAWAVNEHVEMKPNRALIFQASKLHMASPLGGFGKDTKSVRVVLTCFFS